MLRKATYLYIMSCLALAQLEEEIPYELKQIQTDNPEQVNLLELECYNPELMYGEKNAFFWLDNTPLADLTTVWQSPINPRNIQFTITRKLEGEYTCGIQRDPVNRLQSEPQRLVGKFIYHMHMY